VHQAKYTKDIVQKFKMEDSKAMATPMSTTTTLDADEEGEHVDHKEYRSMIRSDSDEAGHPILGMSVRSFSSVSKDFASAGSEANFQVLASHSRLRPLVLRVLFFGSS
jgi:predicted deacylase